jgi:hypothetical protein
MSREDFMFWVRGALRSWTIWFGVILAAAPEIVATIEPTLRPLAGEGVWVWISASAKVIGAVVIALRMRTTEALPDKGGR